MMKQSAKLFIVLMIAVFICSCQRITVSDSYAPVVPESTPAFSAPDSLNQKDDKSIYQFNKPLLENDALLEIAPLDLPSEINGRKLSLSSILSKTQLLVLLYEEYTVPILQEVGIYELTSGEYRSFFMGNG